GHPRMVGEGGGHSPPFERGGAPGGPPRGPEPPLLWSKEMAEPEELLTVREVARRLRVDDTTVRRWIKHGTLEAVSLPHVGKRQAYRVRRRTIESLLNQPSMPS